MTQYKLVPVEPTVDMTIAGMTDGDDKKALFSDHANFVYSQMLDAAPPSPDPYKALEIAREALAELLRLRAMKHALGPTAEYLRDKPIAWGKASEAIRQIDEVMK